VGNRVLVVQNDAADPIGVLGDWLRTAGLDLVELRADEGTDVPADLGGFDGLIVLGGAQGANDDADAPWLPNLRALLRRAVSDEVPTLGICLGGQLLALAMGGRVERSPEGPEYGAQLIAKRAAASTDPLFGTLPITPDVIQWHVDAITELPPGAILLASSPTVAVQAFRIGRLAWGTQFHIETTPELVRSWAEADLAEYDVERLLARSDAAHADIAEVWTPVAAAFAGVVRDPDAVRTAGRVRESTAEPITDAAAIRAALAAEAQAAARPPGPVPLGDPMVRPDPYTRTDPYSRTDPHGR
jgi:GMP synthase (glutamine-hydrolysing)